MTNMQLTLAAQEAPNYKDTDAFVSDLLLSASFLTAEDEAAEPDLDLAEPLRRVWTAAAAPFTAYLAELGLSQSAAARRFRIPLRTIQHWAAGDREAPVYLRLLMAEAVGYVEVAEC